MNFVDTRSNLRMQWHSNYICSFYLFLLHGTNFSSRKLWQTVVNKHFGRQNIGGLAALCSKTATIKVFGR